MHSYLRIHTKKFELKIRHIKMINFVRIKDRHYKDLILLICSVFIGLCCGGWSNAEENDGGASGKNGEGPLQNGFP